jgi:hypothetical protein
VEAAMLQMKWAGRLTGRPAVNPLKEQVLWDGTYSGGELFGHYFSTCNQH